MAYTDFESMDLTGDDVPNSEALSKLAAMDPSNAGDLLGAAAKSIEREAMQASDDVQTNRLLEKSAKLDKAARDAQQGRAMSGNWENNIPPYLLRSRVDKGGIITAGSQTYSAGAGTQTNEHQPAQNARITGTTVLFVTAVATGELANPGEARKIEVSANVGGEPIENLDRIPLYYLLPNTLAGPSLFPVLEPIGGDQNITIQQEVTTSLATTEQETVFVDVWCGDSRRVGSGQVKYG